MYFLKLATAATLNQPMFRKVKNNFLYYAVPFGFPWHTAYTEVQSH